MHTNLQEISEFIQAYVRAISAIMNVGVTVVDRNMRRVGGTDHYLSQIGEIIHHGSFYEKIMATGLPATIEDSEQESLCKACGNRANCTEVADIAYPIFYENEVVGTIGIVAFTQEERDRLLEKNQHFELFLQYMSVLIESKLHSFVHNQALEHQLGELINESKKALNETGFIGENLKIREILALIKKIKRSDSTVLITGESGTGKDVLAKVIHNSSCRENKLMISVNCGAIPENLVESELFGYVGGAFTGANKQGAMGKFELANNSTLFLDEIGEMPLSAQTTLLRVLQEKEVQRIGGKETIPVNVRVICATNQDLLSLVAERKFRMDLYYRINVIPIVLPPLRERLDDIPLFIDSFISSYNKKLKKSIYLTDSKIINAFLSYDWPGNVRELKNIIEYLVNIKESGSLQLADLPSHFMRDAQPEYHDIVPEPLPLKQLLDEYEKEILLVRLTNAQTAEEKQQVADSLAISLASLYRKAAKYNL